MTLAERVQLQRAEEQARQVPLFDAPPVRVVAGRAYCHCGCGRWWYEPKPRPFHRPRQFATPDCILRHRRAKRAALRANVAGIRS